ncbi:hypothetical protein TWF481_001365 [Arthrobotrys musiformis]|uniref:Uncharacterized protein n=1 Tax=Arthrobotrys musiformis TaxID=47236 RepID=A0AAV9WR81_9PEZI
MVVVLFTCLAQLLLHFTGFDALDSVVMDLEPRFPIPASVSAPACLPFSTASTCVLNTAVEMEYPPKTASAKMDGEEEVTTKHRTPIKQFKSLHRGIALIKPLQTSQNRGVTVYASPREGLPAEAHSSNTYASFITLPNPWSTQALKLPREVLIPGIIGLRPTANIPPPPSAITILQIPSPLTTYDFKPNLNLIDPPTIKSRQECTMLLFQTALSLTSLLLTHNNPMRRTLTKIIYLPTTLFASIYTLRLITTTHNTLSDLTRLESPQILKTYDKETITLGAIYLLQAILLTTTSIALSQSLTSPSARNMRKYIRTIIISAAGCWLAVTAWKGTVWIMILWARMHRFVCYIGYSAVEYMFA